MEEATQKGLANNIKKFHLMNFLDGMWFPLPIFVIFMLDKGITLSQLGIIFSAATLVQFIFEIPSSIWADKYSRKMILIFNGVFFLLCNLAFFISGSFEYFLLAFCFSGISNALNSGTFSALIYDTLLSLGREKEYEKIQAKVSRDFFLGRFSASLFGAFLYSLNPYAVFLLAMAVNVVYLLVTASVAEPLREKSINAPLRQVREGIDFLIKTKIIWQLIIIFSIMVATSDVLYTFYQPVLRAAEIPIMYLGAAYFLINALGYLSASLYIKIKNKIGWKAFMVFYLAAALLSSFFLGTQLIILILLAIVLLSFSFGSQNIFISNIINQSVPSSHRSTALSLQSQLYMLIYSILINIVSFGVDHNSFIFGMLLNASIVFIALFIFIQISYGKKYLCMDTK